jgi:membrane-associated protease RseP (regulator of RpoE activity)
MDFQVIGAIIFFLLLSLFLFKKRKKVKIQHVLFIPVKRIIIPIIYLLLYRAKWGLTIMDSFASRFKKILGYVAFVSIVVGFLGMPFILFTLIENLVKLLTVPEAAPAVKLVLPFFTTKVSIGLPFFYWLISLFIIAIVHEFSHGIIARLYNIKLKSSGFAFLGIGIPIMPIAFVEPDEKEIQSRPKKQQLAVYSAGPFSNIILAFIFLGIYLSSVTAASPMFDYNGLQIVGLTNASNLTSPAAIVGVTVGEIIKEVDTFNISSKQDLADILADKSPGDTITLVTNRSSYVIPLGKNPENAEKPYLGVYIDEEVIIKPSFEQKYGRIIPDVIIWFLGLFFWLFALNFGIGIFNLIPLGPVDGGRMLYTSLLQFFSKERATKIWKFVSMLSLFLIIANLLFAFF